MKKVLFFTILSIIELTLIMLIIFFPTIRTYMVITAITIFLTSGVIYKNIFSNNKTGEVDLLEDGYEINHVLDYIEESILSGKEVTKGNLIHLANEMLQSIRGFDLTTISSNDTALFDFLLFMFEDLKTKLDKTKIDAHGFELYTDCVKEVMLEVARKENLIISNINELIDRRVMFYKAYCGNNVDSFFEETILVFVLQDLNRRPSENKFVCLEEEITENDISVELYELYYTVLDKLCYGEE